MMVLKCPSGRKRQLTGPTQVSNSICYPCGLVVVFPSVQPVKMEAIPQFPIMVAVAPETRGHSEQYELQVLQPCHYLNATKPNGVCVSQGGRFPPFTSEGKPPKKGPKDLTLCRVFRKRTCCDITQTYPALLVLRKLASTGEANQECLGLWELLECSICDPRVGVQPGPPLICASFCDRIYEACSNAYFSMDVKTQIVAPCGVNDFVCGRAAEWVSNGTDLCLASVAESWKASQFGVTQRGDRLRVFEDFPQWVRQMPFSERISWAIGGMVLTAGLVFMSKRQSHNQRQKLAAIRRTARKLEGRTVEQRPSSSCAQENRKRFVR